MCSEAKGTKWSEQIICQCTLDQSTSGVTGQVATILSDGDVCLCIEVVRGGLKLIDSEGKYSKFCS